MLNYLIRASLNHRLLVIGLAVFCLVYGSLIITNTPVDVLPDLNRPVVTILTEAPGMAPEEVETFITRPVEAAVSGLPGVERVRSVSGTTLSIVHIDFAWGTDIYRNRQMVSEKLALVADQLPQDVSPVMGSIESLMGEVQLVGLTSNGMVSSMDLRSYADKILKPRLISVLGVGQVLTIGGEVKQYEIMISAEKIGYYQLSLDEVEQNLTKLSRTTSGGFLQTKTHEALLRNIGSVHSIEDIENSVVGMHLGIPVLVKDIATVKIGAQLKRGDAGIDAEPAVILAIHKQPKVNTLELTDRINVVLDDIRDSLPPGIMMHTELFKQADFIRSAIGNVVEVLRDGGIFVGILLFLFLLNVKTTLVSLTAIPLSFILTFIIFKAFDMTINTMTLGGLAIAIGELVDDAIVDVENVFRRLKENRLLANPQPALKVIYHASCEVRNSIVFATLIVLFVFLPLFFLSGIERSFFQPLGVAYVVSLLGSLLVSLTVTPVMCSYLFRTDKSLETKTSFLVRHLKSWNETLLNKVLSRPKATIAVVALLFIGSLLFLPFMGTAFLPPLQEPTAMISIISRPGISLAASSEIGQQAEKIILEFREVAGVSRRTGRAEDDEHAEGVHTSEIDVYFRSDVKNRHKILNGIRERLVATIPKVFVNIGQPISHRIDHMMSGLNSQIALKVYGPDFSTILQKSTEVLNAIKDIPGLVDVQLEQQIPITENKIFIMRESAAQKGIIIGDLLEGLEMAFNGTRVAQLYDEQRNYNVIARFDEPSRANLELIKGIPVKLMPNGTRVTLEDIADVYTRKGPNVINRENNRRRIAIQANAHGRDVGSLIHDIKGVVDAKITFDRDQTLIYDGEYEHQQKASRAIFWLSLFSLLSIFMLLYGHFSSMWLAGQVMMSIPLAMMGAFVALFLSDRTWSIASMIGLITLCGIAARNSIMMLSHYLYLMKEENEPFSLSMVIRGTQERLTPVLMTSCTAILGLLPLVFSGGDPGKEILHPLSVVIVGGLITSTLINLVLTPVIFYHYGEKSAYNALRTKERI